METKFIEVSNNEKNWGKFILLRFDSEKEHKSAITGRSLLREVGWNIRNIIVFDLQTGEGARFVPGGAADVDLKRKKIWVCPMFEPFLMWLYGQPLEKLENLPNFVNLPDAEFDFSGYRREGEKMEEIHFNIWDDYADGDKTHGYIEQEMPEDEQEAVAAFIFQHLKTMDLGEAQIELSGEDIDFKNLTHEQREKLVESLKNSGLKFNGIPINFYSES